MTIVKELELDIAGKDVLIVEDILDTGTTLNFLVQRLRQQQPRSIRICTLLDKKHRRRVDIAADYVGFSLEDGFLIGYGLDFNETGRFLPDIYVVEV